MRSLSWHNLFHCYPIILFAAPRPTPCPQRDAYPPPCDGKWDFQDWTGEYTTILNSKWAIFFSKSYQSIRSRWTMRNGVQTTGVSVWHMRTGSLLETLPSCLTDTTTITRLLAGSTTKRSMTGTMSTGTASCECRCDGVVVVVQRDDGFVFFLLLNQSNPAIVYFFLTLTSVEIINTFDSTRLVFIFQNDCILFKHHNCCHSYGITFHILTCYTKSTDIW